MEQGKGWATIPPEFQEPILATVLTILSGLCSSLKVQKNPFRHKDSLEFLEGETKEGRNGLIKVMLISFH